MTQRDVQIMPASTLASIGDVPAAVFRTGFTKFAHEPCFGRRGVDAGNRGQTANAADADLRRRIGVPAQPQPARIGRFGIMLARRLAGLF